MASPGFISGFELLSAMMVGFYIALKVQIE
jgi:hypothetical protein